MSSFRSVFGSIRRNNKTPTPDQQSRGLDGDQYPSSLNPFSSSRHGSPSASPNQTKRWPEVQVDTAALRGGRMVSPVAPIVDNSANRQSQNLSPAPISPHLTGGSSPSFYNSPTAGGRISPFQRQPSPLSAHHTGSSTGNGFGQQQMYGRVSPGPAPLTSFPQGSPQGNVDPDTLYQQQQITAFQQQHPGGYPNIQYSPQMTGAQAYHQQTTVYSNATIDTLEREAQQLRLNDNGFAAPQPGSNNPFANSDGAGSNAPAPAPTGTGPQRAGTFDEATGTFRNLADIRTLNPEQIRAIFDTVTGVNYLKEVDTVFVLDNSKSMADYGFWRLAEVVLSYLAPIVAAYDQDGYSAYVLNRRGRGAPAIPEKGIAAGGWNHLKSADEVMSIFRTITPSGTTPIDTVLENILQIYLDRLALEVESPGQYEPLNPLNIVFLTDGAADDPEEVERVIEETCEILEQLGMPPNQIGIQFLQIGDINMATQHLMSVYARDPRQAERLIRIAEGDIQAATEWLEKVDDFMGKLAKDPKFKKLRDIVDTKSARDILNEGGFDPVVLIRILCGALNKRFDMQPVRGRR